MPKRLLLLHVCMYVHTSIHVLATSILPQHFTDCSTHRSQPDTSITNLLVCSKISNYPTCGYIPKGVESRDLKRYTHNKVETIQASMDE